MSNPSDGQLICIANIILEDVGRRDGSDDKGAVGDALETLRQVDKETHRKMQLSVGRAAWDAVVYYIEHPEHQR